MSKYTTGEMAKLCNVTVRTVQYYDSRGILVPSELSEGKRRLYSEEDLKKLKIICFLRDVGIPIKGIGELLEEDNTENVISVLLEEQEKVLRDELSEKQDMLDRVEQIKRELKGLDNYSVESIGDIAYIMENRKKLRKLHKMMMVVGIPLDLVEVGLIALWIVKGIWIPFLVFVPVVMVGAFWFSKYYFDKVAYICPECHEVFKAKHVEGFFAAHTPRLRKLTCSCCGHKGYCVETYGMEEKIYG
ncbi:MAG: MerR family transcriptional regulator [Lachnospiraceae bacterium]|nr:MerR family transcriptional regulator [Lachnospiraceae bacterium]